jgi:hypothetical protein
MDAAHLLDVAGAAEPSFFELASQRSMALVLGPALKYLVTVLASWRPRELGRLLGRIDEVHPLLPAPPSHLHPRQWTVDMEGTDASVKVRVWPASGRVLLCVPLPRLGSVPL